MILLHMLKVSTSSWSLPPSSMLPKVYRTEGHHSHIWGLLIVSYYIFKSNLRYPDLFMCILLLRTYCKDSNKILSSCNLMCIVTPKVATINKLLSQGSTIFVPRPWVIDSPVYSAIWHFKLWVLDNLTAKQFFEWFFFFQSSMINDKALNINNLLEQFLVPRKLPKLHQMRDQENLAEKQM